MDRPVVLVVVAVVAIAVVVGGAVATKARSRSARAAAIAAAQPGQLIRHTAPAQPMVDLESALDHVVNDSGRTLRDELDAETTHVERLRRVDDTNPILRRALDEFVGSEE